MTYTVFGMPYHTANTVGIISFMLGFGLVLLTLILWDQLNRYRLLIPCAIAGGASAVGGLMLVALLWVIG